MTTQPRPKADTRIAEGGELLAEYIAGGRQRTDLLRALADLIVDLRQDFQLKDGRPDLGGRSPEYRATMRAIYDRAKVVAEDRDAIQTALRYHVNNRLHELHGTDELTAAGLGERSAKERLAADREQASLIRAALKDPLLLAERIGALAEHIDPEKAAGQPSVQARATRQAYDDAAERIAAAVAAINAAYPRRARRA